MASKKFSLHKLEVDHKVIHELTRKLDVNTKLLNVDEILFYK